MGHNRDTKFIKAFGINLKRLRENGGLTQEELAGKCDLPLSQIGRIERGERGPTLSTILVLSRGLGVEPKALLDFKFK